MAVPTELLSWEHIGVVLGGTISGLVVGTIWWTRHLQSKAASSTNVTNEHGGVIRRDEYMTAMAEIRVRLEDALLEAREARGAATAAQAGLTTIGQMIESSMRALGDRLEGALRDVKTRMDVQTETLSEHHGRLSSVETELRVRRDA